MNALERIMVEPKEKATACVIWLHGLGADGYDFEPIVHELNLPTAHGIRFIFPHAPMQPVTINNGYVMRAWYDITAMDFNAIQDESGIRKTSVLIRQLIQEQMEQGIDSKRIVLAGFSQGGAIALHLGLRFEKSLAGIMALSTYLPLSNTVTAERSECNFATPILMAHGRNDTVVLYPWAWGSKSTLEELGYGLEWHDYPMPHSVCAKEIEHISNWLQRVLFLDIERPV